MTQLQAQGHSRLPAASRSSERLATTDFRLLPSRTVGDDSSLLALKVCGNLLWQFFETNTPSPILHTVSTLYLTVGLVFTIIGHLPVQFRIRMYFTVLSLQTITGLCKQLDWKFYRATENPCHGQLYVHTETNFQILFQFFTYISTCKMPDIQHES